MLKIIIDDFYEIGEYSLIKVTDGYLTIEVVFDLVKYSDFQDYCTDKVLNKQKMILGFQGSIFCCEIVGCSFALGVISYDEDERVESINTTAIGILEFVFDEDFKHRQMIKLLK